MSKTDTITVKRDDFTDDLLNMGYTKGIKDGYNKAIDDVIKAIDDICDTERDRCNDFGCCSDCYKSGIKEMAEQLKR